jgi:flagellar export protein FliJ
MNTQTKRVSRLTELADKQVNAARTLVAKATEAVAQARVTAERTAAAWTAAAQGFGQNVTSAHELEEQANRLRTLRMQADIAAQRVDSASAEERRCTAALVEATMDKRKLERWGERLEERERDTVAREEQRAFDQLAARTVRGRP